MSQVHDTVLRLVELYEPLRTTYQQAGGTPVQRVHHELALEPAIERAEPSLPIERVDRLITDYADPDRTTAELVSRPIAMTDSLGWQGVLVSTDGAPMFLSLSFSHLILDVWSVIELGRQFRELVAAPHCAAVTARIGPSPRELARRQQQELSSPRQDGIERYWRRILSDDLIHQLPTLAPGATSNRIQATLHSRHLGRLVAQVGKQLGATPPAVLLALVAAGLSAHTGSARFAISVMSSNRFAPELQHAVGTLNQLIPVLVTVDQGQSLAEHAKKLHWASARAYRYSSYDLDRVAAIAATTGPQAGSNGWFNDLFPCWFNYLQFDDHPAGDGDPAEDNPAELAWTPLARQYGQPFDVRVTLQGGLTSLALRTDPDVIDAQALASILRTVALGVQRLATDSSSPIGGLWTSAGQQLAPLLFPEYVEPADGRATGLMPV